MCSWSSFSGRPCREALQPFSSDKGAGSGGRSQPQRECASVSGATCRPAADSAALLGRAVPPCCSKPPRWPPGGNAALHALSSPPPPPRLSANPGHLPVQMQGKAQQEEPVHGNRSLGERVQGRDGPPAAQLGHREKDTKPNTRATTNCDSSFFFPGLCPHQATDPFCRRSSLSVNGRGPPAAVCVQAGGSPRSSPPYHGKDRGTGTAPGAAHGAVCRQCDRWSPGPSVWGPVPPLQRASSGDCLDSAAQEGQTHKPAGAGAVLGKQ